MRQISDAISQSDGFRQPEPKGLCRPTTAAKGNLRRNRHSAAEGPTLPQCRGYVQRRRPSHRLFDLGRGHHLEGRPDLEGRRPAPLPLAPSRATSGRPTCSSSTASPTAVSRVSQPLYPRRPPARSSRSPAATPTSSRGGRSARPSAWCSSRASSRASGSRSTSTRSRSTARSRPIRRSSPPTARSRRTPARAGLLLRPADTPTASSTTASVIFGLNTIPFDLQKQTGRGHRFRGSREYSLPLAGG